MLAHILHNSRPLCTFIRGLGLNLSLPQARHVINLVDAILMTEGRKTIAALRRQCVYWVDPSNIADALAHAPWSGPQVRRLAGTLLLRWALQRLPRDGSQRILISLDDSLALKDPDTRHLQGVDWHCAPAAHRRGRQKMQNSQCYLLCHMAVAGRDFTFAIEPYLREQTVRRLNRQRPGPAKLHFRCKRRLAQAILAACQPLLPPEVPVYVLFDSWYASARLIKYIRRQGWHVICRIQSNRKLNGQRLDHSATAQQHQRYVPVNIVAADGNSSRFLLRSLVGRLHELPTEVRVLVSKRHYRDHHPTYFVSTDLTLPAPTALQWYAKRWQCEVDHFYLKQRLGWGDFRVQSYEAIDRFCALVQVAWNYLQWQVWDLPTGAPRNPGEALRRHRDEHAREWLAAALRRAQGGEDVERILAELLGDAA